MTRAIRLLACVPALFLSTCCCDDDDCWWTTECYWTACCYTCYDVQHCDPYHGMAATRSEDLDFDAIVAEAGDGRIDVLVRVTGKRVDGTTPIGVRLIGPEMSGLRRESPKAVWGFHGIPISAAERIEVVVAGTDIRVERELPIEDLQDPQPCGLRERLLGTAILAPAPAGLALGTDLAIVAPPAEELLASGTSIGLEVDVLRPGDSEPVAVFLREGETATVRLDQAGRWVFRSTLLTDDVCGEPSADSVSVEETEIDVR